MLPTTACCCFFLQYYCCTFPLQKLDTKFGINMSYKSEILTITLFNNKINPILKFFNLIRKSKAASWVGPSEAWKYYKLLVSQAENGKHNPFKSPSFWSKTWKQSQHKRKKRNAQHDKTFYSNIHGTIINKCNFKIHYLCFFCHTNNITIKCYKRCSLK